MTTQQQPRPYVPSKSLDTPYPLIDNDPHLRRVIGYARPSDYLAGAAIGVAGPGMMLLWERLAPSHVGKGGFPPIMRLAGALGLVGGVMELGLTLPSVRFYGFRENQREVEKDMREMVDKVKKGEPLYGKSSLSPHMQGVASRNSRYSGVWLHVLPWFNIVNHEQHGVDTAKYYQQAEKELEAERTKS
ncbi:hypothetical protein MMC11_008417 [Xylographa trunciseda]|nr:hypothetical protein [Xylographa trunciseda]